MSSDEWVYDINGWDLKQDLAVELEVAVEKLQMDLSDYLHEGAVDGNEDWETPSGYPYCGCTTCEAREVLSTVVPIVAQAYADGRIRKTDDSEAGVALLFNLEEKP